MVAIKNLLKDGYYLAGLGCILGSLFIFISPSLFSSSRGEISTLFSLNYAITAGYFFTLVFSKSRRNPAMKLNYRLLLLVLFLISAYTLNREITVFNESVNWLSILLVLSCSNYVLLPIFNQLPSWGKHISSGILGISFVLFTYLAIYLLPIYPFGIFGLPLLGVSLHVFVPVLLAVNTIYLIRRFSFDQKNIWYSFLAGILLPLILATVFVIRWNNLKNELNQVYKKGEDKELPAWIKAVQQTPQNDLAEKLLKAGLVYSIPNMDGNFFWNTSNLSFGEKKKHDPLVMISAFFAGTTNLDQADRIRLLKTAFKGRHEAEERLWSGIDLVTSNVTTAVRIWPVCNIAYTEKTVTVDHTISDSWQTRNQEAIYTFYLPEGGVVTSLSLWINGNEEKAILTTREKADSAYKTIVGVERRDPSVVHWQEGNMVSVRVFPVLPGETRMFKIGITAPLARRQGELQYENIYFDGPDKSKAKETIQVDFDQPVESFNQPFFVSKSDRSYNHKGNYTPYWNLSLPDKGLSGCTYSFDNKTYSLKPYHKKLVPVAIDAIYLDVNEKWKKAEYDELLEKNDKRKVYVYDDELTMVNEGNAEKLFEQLQKKKFTLFPVYKIDNPSTSLLITKGGRFSCNLDDLDETVFMSETKKFLSGQQKIKVFNLDSDLSPYLKSLKEFRVFQYDRGDMDVLKHILEKNVFAEDTEDDAHVIIHKSDMVIEKNDGATPSSGPDHIMRLFAYNHIMQKLGAGLITNRPVEDELVTEARVANVVSPLSSLVVLETEKDYERFDINDIDNSLKNASLKSKGAVPEPHEWVLIILGAIMILYVRFYAKLKWIKAR
jgi:XrtN system VIT domain protein